ncbi:MAG: type II toxin-antitoxin system RelE/ParE family toxin [Paracoccaceae bacterium]|nr:type II toxin-antitoxin system RelE/ParE family toxin [Paracoccaceae bacterium]
MPASRGFVLRPAARADLANIWTEGAATWGVAQADHYVDALFGLFDLLAAFPEMARERQEFTPPIRIHPGGAHLVLYRWEGQGVEILRILHGHQNLTAYLLEG